MAILHLFSAWDDDAQGDTHKINHSKKSLEKSYHCVSCE